MKYTLLLSVLLATAASFAQNPRLTRLWETDSIIAIPESVLPDPANNTLYISLIDGAPWEADGKGGIAKLSPDGTIYTPSWITGLHAPKGMGMKDNRLYVADMKEVVVIDIAAGRIEKRIPISKAVALNDITITSSGVIYVSDSRTGTVYRIENDLPAVYLENLAGLNGLKAVGNELIIAAGKSFVKADENGRISPIAELPQGGDGIEPVGNGDYIVSSWPGYIYYVQAGGKVSTLLDTHLEKKNTADLGFDPARRILYVPTFFKKTVVAYTLEN